MSACFYLFFCPKNAVVKQTHVLTLGIKPESLRLLAWRSNQLSYADAKFTLVLLSVEYNCCYKVS